ncbi:DUF3500 domain-containing protein [Stigmatella sp. ncwal1]|uniref:DUF3500 domain-containing protein n=1 Tax=Stigmatella ashevillensis TaxID=2995309 RepID=A0ABT5DBB9_9BACT|nr:DUF3500 domain-containing protein [Stigmatella ashevillena]MDC0710405.1 DUF3500 domain-containing protein [Stigmatella ashevillena]
MVRTRWGREERGLLFAGLASLAGLGAISLGACGDGDDGTVPDDGGGTASCASDATTAENTAAVVAAANTLLAGLTSEQRTAILYEKTLANAQQWSNFPTTFVKRNGVRMGDMSTDAQNAAVALANVAAGATGSTLLAELREADQWLVTNGNASSTDYGRGLYYFSFHGTPSTTSPWMLQIGGHHLAYNFTYNGKCTSATPLFDGSEPMTWTDTTGTVHAPLEAQRAPMAALVNAVRALPDAKLSGTFSDLVNGPAGGGPGGGGGGDTRYPSSLTYPTGTTGRGVSVSTLSDAQKALVKAAIEAWVKNVADPVSTALLAQYESDEALAQTYVGYSGSADLSTQSSYVRIDGPRVWIEVTVQGGIIYRNVVHWHTIWRDKVADYGAEYVSQ